MHAWTGRSRAERVHMYNYTALAATSYMESYSYIGVWTQIKIGSNFTVAIISVDILKSPEEKACVDYFRVISVITNGHEKASSLMLA